jgi:gliding motility-associated-like protein
VPFYYFEVNPVTGNPVVFTGPPHLAVYQTFLWDFGVPGMISDTSGDMHPIFNYPNVGEYTVTLTGNPYSSCPSQYSFDISIHQKVNLDILADTFAMCINGNSFNFQAVGNINEDSTFHWFFENNTDTLESFVKNPQNISWNSTGMHIVSLVMEDAFCRDSTSDTIYVDPELDIGFISNSNPLCTNTPGDFEIDEAASAYSNGATFIWDFGDGDSARSKTASHLFDVPGNYTVALTVNNPNGCPDTLTFPLPVTITVNPSPTAELISDTTAATMFNPVIQFTDLSVDAVLTDFDPGDGSSFSTGNVTHTYSYAGDFWATLIVENTFGCIDKDSLKISIEPYFSMFIPNAFSPDGDGINDYFGPVGGGITQYVFRVFNRWGELVFESDSIEKQWDGTVNGGRKIAKQDVYAYTLSVVDFQKQQYSYTGKITLLR